MSVRKKFITSREAVSDIDGNNGSALMVPLTGSLYVRGKLSEEDSLIVGQFFVKTFSTVKSYSSRTTMP